MMPLSEALADVFNVEIKELVNTAVLRPLGMHHSALGMGLLERDNIMRCQTEFGALAK